MDNQEIENILAAINASGIESNESDLLNWFKEATKILPGQDRYDGEGIKKIAEKLSASGSIYNFENEISRRNLARWFEIPEEEFENTPKEQLEPGVLIRHIGLENMFKKWFTEWNYEVSVGDDLEGLENIEFIPDIYAKRVTLHGIFEIVVCFVCDNPPSTYRVRALFEAFESFARDGSEFGERDIFIIATPYTFGKGITQSISLQNSEERYRVVGLESNDISILESIKTPEKRLYGLLDHVEKANNKLRKDGLFIKKN